MARIVILVLGLLVIGGACILGWRAYGAATRRRRHEAVRARRAEEDRLWHEQTERHRSRHSKSE